MHEVIFYVKFVTGTTRTEPQEAIDMCRKMLLDCLRNGGTISTAPDSNNGLFQFYILGEHAEKLGR